MATSRQFKKGATWVVGLVVLSTLAIPFSSPTSAAPASFADPAFSSVWNLTDKPVDAHIVNRSWVWGPEGFYTTYEPYLQGPGGQHLVEYFDKSRMEINNPAGNRNDPWYVTNGLLVVDMISGKIQAGDAQFISSSPANIPVAGDPQALADTPTYAALAGVASLNGDKRAPNRTGQSIREGLGANGNTAVLDNLAQYSKDAVYEPTLGHNIADVFWSFLNQQGPVYQNGQYVNGALMNWVYVMGYPITEPYWVHINAAGQTRWVLMQAFQRRILTYSPANPDGWKVEMGNVGRAYYDWRYHTPPATPTPAPPPPAPTATPVPGLVPNIALNPSRGDATQSVQINGTNFPPYAAVTLSLEKASAGYSVGLTTLGANSDGTFSFNASIPLQAAKLGELTFRASANNGTKQATAIYQTKAIFTDYGEVVTRGNLHVYGVGMPAGMGIKIGVQIGDNGRNITWLDRIIVGGDRVFNTTVNIGGIAVGSSIRMIGQTDDGYRVTSLPLRVIAQPTLSVTPSSGRVNVNVTLHGTNWPKNRAILVGKKSPDGARDVWNRNAITTDVNGNFTVTVNIGNDYAGQRSVRLAALDPYNGVRVEVVYTISR